MVPIDEGIIQAHLQPLGSECIQELPDQIPAAGSVGGLKIGILTIEQAEPVMVLGGEHGVAHARLSRSAGPSARIEIHGIEFLPQGFVGFGGHLFGAAHPFPPSRDGVKPPMNEQAKAVVAEPLRALHDLFQ